MRKPSVLRTRRSQAVGAALAGVGLIGASLTYASMATAGTDNSGNTTTPIKHVVVLFDENESYDHYFGTYPNATNADGVPFTAAAGTPASNNYAADPTLISDNKNSTKPFRLTPAQALTCSQNHNYRPEQLAVSGDNPDGTPASTGPMSTFPENTVGSSCGTQTVGSAINMGYYDGNTVTGLWNYAQNYAMSDNSWDDNFGPSTVGALNVVSGQTGNATAYSSGGDDTNPTPLTGSSATASGFSAITATSSGNTGTVIGDPDPVYDDCADMNSTTGQGHGASSNLVGMQGKNIGDLLNAKGVTWGWFQGGFAPTTPYAGTGTYASCAAKSTGVEGQTAFDYSPHHDPFQYYKSTSNPHHLAPASPAEIGHNGQANHQYDLSEFSIALQTNNLPAVSYLKAAAYQDGHPGNSDPIDEQHFLVNTINEIEASPEWSSTAIVIAYDDSDGWYDHQAPTIINGSNTSDDAQVCTSAPTASSPLGGIEDRCGPSQRLPFLVISPYAKENYIDHTKIGQASVVKFIEQNWGLGTIGGGSFDATDGSINSLFNFSAPQNRSVLLNQNGTVASVIARTSTGGGKTTPPPAAARGKVTSIGVVGVNKVVKAKKKIKASFLFAATASVSGPVKLYDRKKVIASGTASENVAKLKFKLKKKGKHKLHLSYLGSSTVDPFTGKTFKVKAK